MRIIFISHAAKRIGDFAQHPFLSHIAAPASTLSGLKETFETMIPVTAKVALMAQTGQENNGAVTAKWTRDGNEPEKYGRVCWISGTPLFDFESMACVWMVVIVDDIIIQWKRRHRSNFGHETERDRCSRISVKRDHRGGLFR
jgi:hypothetical protein